MRAKHLIGGWERADVLQNRFDVVSNLDSLYVKRVQVGAVGIDNPVPMVEFVDADDDVVIRLTVWEYDVRNPMIGDPDFVPEHDVVLLRWEKPREWDESSKWMWDLSATTEDGVVFVTLIRRVPVIVDDGDVDDIEDGDVFVDESGRTHTVGVGTHPQTGWVLALNERRKK